MVFEGVKIIDFSWAIAGPLISKTLADYGATVINIEVAKRPNILRTSMPYKDNIPGMDRSGFFAYINANKYSMSLDIDHPKGRELAKRLIACSDIVNENFSPGTMEKWELGYDQLKDLKSDIIMVRSSLLGQTGPFSRHRGFGYHLNALAGFTHFTGWRDVDPLSLMFAYSDYFVPHFGVAILCAAMEYRNRTGKGQMIDLSENESCLQFMAPYLLEYEANGVESGREGNRHPYAVPHNVYRCKGEDRWCAIAVFTDEEWERFCGILGNELLTKVDKFNTFINRKKNEDELDRLIEKWTINYTAQEVMALMQNAGIAAGMVNKGEDIYQDPQLVERDTFWLLNHKEIGDFTHLGQPSKFSKTPAQPRMPAPLIGEHTEYVCREFLGMSENEFDELLVSGVFGL